MDISSRVQKVIPELKSREHDSALNELFSALKPGEPGGKSFCDLKGHESIEGAMAGTKSAIFHCFSEEVEDVELALGVSKKGVPGHRGRERVHIFFILISPIKESGTHFQILSRLEGLLIDKTFVQALMKASGEDGLRREVKRAEGAAKTLFIPLSKEEVFDELETGTDGLTEEETGKRLAKTGPNTLKRVAKGTLLKDLFYNLFINLFALLLWAGGAMAFIAGMPELGWAIFLVIIINAAFSFWQEFKAERAVEAIEKLLPREVSVIRGGREKDIDATILVPGDLIKLQEGDSVPADGRLVEAFDMRVDNSALTGESKPVYKNSGALSNGKGFIWTEVPNLVFAGTSVLSGAGMAVVTATGMDTEIGRVAYMTQSIKAEKSPLQKEIGRITRTVTMIAAALGLLFFFLGFNIAGLTFAESFLFAIGIIVANVPEGLLPTVSLSLAMGVQRMASKNAIVKKLSAVETLGSATVICTDKTGTLTTNQMCVVKAASGSGDALFTVAGTGYSPEGDFILEGSRAGKEALEKKGLLRLLAAAALCNDATLHAPGDGGSQWRVTGDPTEGALLTAARKAGLDLDRLKEDLPRKAHLSFDRVRKRMSTVHGVKGGPWAVLSGGKEVAFIKGAPREILALCVNTLKDGEHIPLTEKDRDLINAQNDSMASEGLRVLGVAFRPVEKKDSYSHDDVEQGMVFLGLMAMVDPPRPGVKEAVAECHTAGIRVVMVTGDYGLTAKAIAAEIGLDGAARVITGEELGNISHWELKEILKKGEVIFARVAPRDKLRVVSALQDNGEIVAVTGDGVNDAPALKKADIGIAMGLRGSDVAKESAEIVLADDNFATIVDAIREGRAVYSNIKKFVTYIFASNIPEVVPFIAFVLMKIPLPLTVMQILAVDLGTDIFPALGLGVEPPEAGVMKQPPRPRNKRLLDAKTLSRAYLFLGPIEAALSMGGFFFVYWLAGWRPGEEMPGSGALYAVATTMTFAGIVACQVGNVFACRTEKGSVFKTGLLRNRFVLASIGVELSIALLLIYTPGLGRSFGFAPLSGWHWAALASFPIIMLASEEARKAAARRIK